MRDFSQGFCVIVVLLLGSLIGVSVASTYVYKNNGFAKVGNGGYFLGGTEHVYGFKGSSFIRFDNVTFVRTKESASKQKSILASAGLVEVIVFEMNKRNQIEESFLKVDGLCCSPELADAGSCKLGDVAVKKDSNDCEWPKQTWTFFKGSNEEVEMSPEDVVVINKAGTYALYFVICNPELDVTIIRGRTKEVIYQEN